MMIVKTRTKIYNNNIYNIINLKMYTTRFFIEEPVLTGLLLLSISTCFACKYTVLASILAVALLGLILFYREPLFKLPFYQIQSNQIASPSYGTITRILHDPETKKRVVSIFLSPLDVHTQYYPIHGYVMDHKHDLNGKFHLAYEWDKSNDNEKVITWMKNLNYGKEERIVKITQIAGYLVRRISTPHRVGCYVHAGDYLGMIKFGSRVDLEFDDVYRLQVREGQYVYGPHTILAEL
jgi:phosphatidylserine decarboxylase